MHYGVSSFWSWLHSCYDVASFSAFDFGDWWDALLQADDPAAAESSYVDSLDSSTANCGLYVHGFTASDIYTFTDCRAYFMPSGVASVDAISNFSKVLCGLDLETEVLIILALSSSDWYGLMWDSLGRLCLVKCSPTLNYVDPLFFGVHSIDDLSSVSVSVICSDEPYFFSKELANANCSGNCYYVDPLNSNNCSTCLSGFYRSKGVWSSFTTSLLGYFREYSRSFVMSVPDYTTVDWHTPHIVTQPSGANFTSRPASLMQTINNYNIDNSYTDNSTTINYYIGTVDSTGAVTDTYNPAVYDETTLIYTDPVTGTQYLTTGWTYDYTTRSYSLTMAEDAYTIGETAVSAIDLTYGDDGVTISHYDSAGTLLQEDAYAYVMAAQSACVINGHSYSAAITQEPSCTAAGERTYTCSVCGDQYVEEISKTDHVYADHTITQEPTCTVGGISSQTCSTCGSQITEKLDALGHDWIAREITETTYEIPDGTSCPDCSGTNYTFTRNGVIYTCTCSDCSAEWSVEADVTYGSTMYSCSRCDETKVEADSTEESQESWFTKFVLKFKWLSAIGTVYRQLVADIVSDADTAAAVADGTVMLVDVTSDHAATDGETVTYTAPELAVSFGESDKYGVDWASIKPLDLSWYAPYKETVDGILSGILWLSYLFLLIKRAPGIIRGAEMVTEDRVKIDGWNFRHGR